MCAPSPPKPPSPKETSAAQTGTNVSTAIANAMMGNVNQVTPNGSLTYNQTGSYTQYDPYTKQSYKIPTFTATQTLSPAQQRLQATNAKTQQNLANLGAEQSSRLEQLLGKPFDLSGLPSAGDPSAITLPNYHAISGGPQLQTSLDATAPVSTSFADVGGPQLTVGPTDFSADRQKVQDALMARLNPQIEQDREALETRLANQGLQPGSEAYNRAIDSANRSANDARLGAILSAGQEQSRLADLAMNQFNAENAAQQQAYNEALGRGTFANQAAAQQFQQGLSAAQFGNQSAQQQYQNESGATQANNALQQQQFGNQMSQIQAENAARQQALQEAYANRNQPINEITALMSGSQVSQPNFVNTSMPTIPTTDVAGNINQNYQQQLAQWQAQASQNPFGSILGGLFGLGNAYISTL